MLDLVRSFKIAFIFIFICVLFIYVSLCVHKWVCVKMCMSSTYGNQFSSCGSQGLNSSLQPCQKWLHRVSHFSLALLKTYLTETSSREIKKRLYDMFCTFIYLIENLRFVSSFLIFCFCGSSNFCKPLNVVFCADISFQIPWGNTRTPISMAHGNIMLKLHNKLTNCLPKC